MTDPEFVQTGVASGRVRLRRGAARAATPTRLGTALLVILLLVAAAYVAGTPLGAGDASASGDPGPTVEPSFDGASPPLGESLGPTAPAATGALESGETSDGTAPEQASSEPDGTEPPDEGPVWTPRIWSFDPDARFEASVVLRESCLLSMDGVEVPHAQVIFQITWDGEVPLSLITYTTDGVEIGGYGGDLEVSGTFGNGLIVTAGEPHVETTRFHADTEEVGPGTVVLEIDTPFNVDPTEPCP